MSYSPPRRTYKILGEREWDWLLYYPTFFANPYNGQFETRTGGTGAISWAVAGCRTSVPADTDYAAAYIFQTGGAANPNYSKEVLSYLWNTVQSTISDDHCLGVIIDNQEAQPAQNDIAVYDILNSRLRVDRAGTDYDASVTNPTIDAYNSAVILLDHEEGETKLWINRSMDEAANASVSEVPRFGQPYQGKGFISGGNDGTEENLQVQGMIHAIKF